MLPEQNDVVIREERGGPSAVYLLGTPAAPDQFVLHTRDQAIEQARRYAQHMHVSVWFAAHGESVVLLVSFRPEQV